MARREKFRYIIVENPNYPNINNFIKVEDLKPFSFIINPYCRNKKRETPSFEIPPEKKLYSYLVACCNIQLCSYLYQIEKVPAEWLDLIRTLLILVNNQKAERQDQNPFLPAALTFTLLLKRAA